MDEMKKRQIVRKCMIMVSLLLFPITLYYMSPYLIIQGIAEGILTGSAILFVAMMVSAIFFGRIFCGWICPAGGLQEACFMINARSNKGKWRKFVKYIIWVPWLLAIIALGLNAGGVFKIDVFYQTWNGISVSNPGGYIIYYGVVFLIFILAVIGGRRSFCHSVCWMAPFMQIGITLRKLLKLPGLHLSTDPDKCIRCGQCTKKCVMSLEVMELVKSKSIKDMDCSLCGECVDVCPKKVIKYDFR
jgi:polyferredoxin